MNLLALTWQQAWELIAWTMCYFFVWGTIIASAGALLRFLARRAAPTIRYTISLAVFAALAMLPVGIAVWLSQNSPIAIATSYVDPPATPAAIELIQPQIAPTSERQPAATTQPATNPDSLQPEAEARYALSVEQAVAYLPWLWLVGAPITFALLATGLVGSSRLRQQGMLQTEGPIFEACQRLRNTLAVSQRVGLAIHARIAQPVLVGILRPLILLPPAALAGWSPDELEMVLLHELAHVRRWDNLINLLQRIVESLLFFHPAVWLVSRQVRRDREQCCDAVVVAHTAKPQAYAELLVRIAAKSVHSPSLATASAMADHPLTARIRHILKLEDEPMLVSRRTLGFTVLATAVVVTVVLWQPVRKTIAEGTTDSTIKQKEEVGKKSPTLYYDGKTFEQWRQMWQTELKVEKRTECIKALAAFGRAGRGKEAAEAIFDVAEQYDFSSFDESTPEGKLQGTVLNLLTKTRGSRLPEAVWLPALQSRIKENPSKWKGLASQLLYRIRTSDETVMKRLDELTRHADPRIRSSALEGMCYSNPKHDNPLVIEAIRRELASNNIDDIKHALVMMYIERPLGGGGGFGGGIHVTKLRYMPEIFPTLFHKNESIRGKARETLSFIQPEDAPQVVEQLVSILNDQKQTAKHLAAVRALSAIGQQASAAVLVLEKLIQHDDLNLAIAAVYAVNTIRGVPNRFYNPATTEASLAFLQRFANELGVKNIALQQPAEKGLQLIEKYQKLYEQEPVKVFPNRPADGGGGGFF